MAKPLPKTKAPAFRKNRKRVPIVAAVAVPSAPVNSFSIPTKAAAARCENFNRGGALMNIETSPQSKKSQTISDSFHAVVTARAVKSAHNSQSFFKVERIDRKSTR